MQYRYKLQLYIIPLITFAIMIITISFIINTSNRIKKLQHNILLLELKLIIEKSNREASFLKQAGIDDVQFYRKGAQFEVINSIKEMKRENTYFFIVDSKGQIIYHPDLMEKDYDNYSLNRLSLKHLLNEKKDIILFDAEKLGMKPKKYSGSFDYFKEWDWIIFMLIETSIINRSIYMASLQSAVISIITIFIAILTVSIISKRFTNPLLEIRDIAIKISEGLLDVHIDIKESDEFIVLSNAFNKMIDNIKSDFEKIKSQRRKIEKNNRELKELLNEKITLLQEVHHRVKNNLLIITAFIELVMESNQNPDVINVMQTCINRVRSMALIHEKIYRSDRLSKVTFKSYIDDLVKNILNSYNRSSSIQFNNNINDNIEFEIDILIPLGLIINELVSNSIKHGFSRDIKGEITILFHTHDSQYIMVYSDSGDRFQKSMTQYLKKPKTLGMEIVNNLILQLRGNLKIIEEKKEFVFTFPLK